MHHQPLRSHLKHTLLTFLIPLSLYALISVSEHLLRLFLSNSDPQKTLENLSDGHSGLQVLTLLIEAKILILSGYSSLFSFFVMMALINLIHLTRLLLISKCEKKRYNSLHDDIWNPPSRKENSVSQGIIQRVIFYAIFYSCLSFAVSITNLPIADSPPTEPVSLLSTLPISNQRFMEEEVQKNSDFDLLDLSDIKSLSIGKVLKTLKVSPIDVVLSKDNKLAFVIWRSPSTLKVIDISDDQNPIIIGSLENLASIEAKAKFKKLALSGDGKTLFASNVKYLEIIDVSNPQIPTLKACIEDSVPDFDQYVPTSAILTMALSSDQTTLYVASFALQIFNITNTSSPKTLYSYANETRMTSLALLSDSKTLLSGNGKLDFYDVFDPKIPKLISSYSSPDLSIQSILLSKSLKKVYAVGVTADHQTAILEEIDLSQRTSLSRYKLGINEVYPFFGELGIIALSPNETNIFVTGKSTRGFDPNIEIIGFDLVKKQIMTQSNTLFVGATIFLMVPGTNNIITNSNNQFNIIKLFKAYPNKINFCLTNNSRGNFEFSSKMRLVESSFDSNFLFAFSFKDTFESYKFASPPQLLGSFKPAFDSKEAKIFIRNNNDIAILQQPQGIWFINISDPTNMTSIRLIQEDSPSLISATAHSFQENILVVFSGLTQHIHVRIVDFSDLFSITETTVLNLNYDGLINIATLTNKGKILFFMTENFNIYNLSDHSNPKLMFSKPLGLFPSKTILLSMILSPDGKNLFILFSKTEMETSLAILDVSDLTGPQVLSVLDLPTVELLQGNPFILSRDAKRGFLLTYSHLLFLNLQNLSSPVVLGMLAYKSLGIEKKRTLTNFFLSPDEKIGYIVGLDELFQVSIDIPYTLYLPQEEFFLGKKSSENIFFLQSDNSGDFLPVTSSEYKIIKFLLYDLSVVPSKASPVISNSSLPSWITFDYENQVLSVEPKTQDDLGSYTLYSLTSKKISRQVFGSNLSGEITSEDMVTLLISLGYLDNQRFLTSGFGSYEDFLLPSQYNKSQEAIHKTLQSYRIETFTDFTVNSSFIFSTDGQKFSIQSPSVSSVKIDIKLQCNEAKFLQKTYNTLQPVITEQKSRFTIEGPLDLVEKALNDLVINLNNTQPCAGEIIINDQMNPPLDRFYQNISEYFFKNEAPKLNASHPLTLQQQIDFSTLETGRSFSISIDPQTFMDNYTEALSFEVIKQGTTLPSWISHQGGLIIKGIPPEELWNREIHLVLIVKNEFKQIEVPFVLKIHITMIFAAKLLLIYSPYILTILGLIVYANRIYNIVFKKRYRYPRDFSLKVGEEITSSVIPPMIFISKEKQESLLILKYLKEKVSRELGKKSIKNIEFGKYFTNSERNCLDKAMLEHEIQETLQDIPKKILKKIRSYVYGSQASKNLVKQIIFNQLTSWLLEANSETKKFFDIIKNDWADLVEWDINGMCKIKESQLLELVAQADLHLENNSIQDKNDNYSLMTENESMKEVVNVSLLKDAIEGHAFNKQSIDYHSTTAHIMIKFKKQTNFIKRFVKKDLEDVNFSDRGKMTYGIYFKVQNDVLTFHGVPEEKFLDKTVVVQITTKKQRILNEIWIHGVSKDQPNHSIAKGVGYEIY